MKTVYPRAAATMLAIALTAMSTACGGRETASTGQEAAADPRQATIHQPTAEHAALGITQPWSDADIEFMSGMIPHHAQAVIMAGWAPTHGARPDVAILCERMVVGQTDEIRFIQQWLADRGLPVPDGKSTLMKHGDHNMLMPGMLTDAEMAALDKARGAEFDRLFLQGMIKHHQGAIDMVDVLLKSYGAAQDDTIYKFASDVYADQGIEINVMKSMLEQKWGGS